MPAGPSAPEITISDRFSRYREFDPEVPVWCLTPHQGRCISRFFDTSPFSPSGRYLACFRLPFEDRVPTPGDTGEVVLIDLREGSERVVATTAGWEPQMGCNLNWAPATDTHGERLVFNDVDTETWQTRVVTLDITTGEARHFPGGVYQVSPDGRYAAAASLEKMRRTQLGYGVVVPDQCVGRNVGTPDDDGLFLTDLHTGERRLLLSLYDAAALTPDLADLSPDELNHWETYGFHTKWSPDGQRLLFSVRRYRHGGLDRFDAFGWGENKAVRFDVFTMRPDGSELVNAMPADKWEKGGHHINFLPDGERLSMNLRLFRDDRGFDLAQVNVDGSVLRKMSDAVDGSGHPTVHPDGRHVLTDTYTHERWNEDGVTPLRWIDLEAGTERSIVRMQTAPPLKPHSVMRLDPHPAWDRSWRWVAFNAIIDGTRRVMVADMCGLLD